MIAYVQSFIEQLTDLKSTSNIELILEWSKKRSNIGHCLAGKGFCPKENH